jgi:anhydro-N-acetylmuramic acid kinase
MRRLAAAAGRDSLIAVGLISGTSADGADAAVVRIKGTGPSLAIEVLHSHTIDYPAGLKERVLAASAAPACEIAALHYELGDFFSAAALEAIEAAGLEPERVHVLGSHGQTVFHCPPSQSEAASPPHGATLQIGDGCLLANRTGIPTVSDFRAADIACGGEGAPLVPYLDWVLFHKLDGATVALNLGGIANVTFVPGAGDAAQEPTPGEGPVPSDVMGFDTGPANMVLDALARKLLPGAPACDRDGKATASGKADERLLARLLDDPFFKRPPPKSTGRESFGAPYLERMLREGEGLSPEDLLATAATLVAETVAAAVRDFLDPALFPPARIVVSGGGVHNCALMAMLDERFYPIPILSSSAFGLPVDGKEAILFAVLAAETIAGTPTSIPAVTGASSACVLGKVSLPAGMRLF